MGEWFSRPVSHFHGRALPRAGDPSRLFGPRRAFRPGPPPPISARRNRDPPPPPADPRVAGAHATPPTGGDARGAAHICPQVGGRDLGVLAALFKAAAASDVADIVRAKPTGAFARRIWFLYEWLTGHKLDIANPGSVRLVRVVDPEQQLALEPGTPPRGTRSSTTCREPAASVRWSGGRPRSALPRKAARPAGPTRSRGARARTVARAAAFLLLSDSKSSFAIEGERPRVPAPHAGRRRSARPAFVP